MSSDLKVKVNIDGGARGNPGPAAAGVVVRADDETILYSAGLYIGHATNNVAEYRALLAGLEAAGKLGASEVDVISDSELLVRQMNGQYRVKNEGLKPLFDKAVSMSRAFKRVSLQHVRREFNKAADKLVNQAIDMKRNVEGD